MKRIPLIGLAFVLAASLAAPDARADRRQRGDHDRQGRHWGPGNSRSEREGYHPGRYQPAPARPRHWRPRHWRPRRAFRPVFRPVFRPAPVVVRPVRRVPVPVVRPVVVRVPEYQQVGMYPAQFATYLGSLGDLYSDQARLDALAVDTAVSLSAAQTRQILDLFFSDAGRLSALSIVAPRMADPENAALLYGAFFSDDSRQQARVIISGCHHSDYPDYPDYAY